MKKLLIGVLTLVSLSAAFGKTLSPAHIIIEEKLDEINKKLDLLEKEHREDRRVHEQLLKQYREAYKT
jgi:hypothetical protein